ncbi:DOMON domain-containing protein [Fangia hongkongensis]|uniref:DOMON domain-containing protein n=2 Tax=Fangia hongkongensis TaxID=270495 RepID=UPI000A012596|nr:DOMON domain-containing protein [Fangia hongkongensis]
MMRKWLFSVFSIMMLSVTFGFASTKPIEKCTDKVCSVHLKTIYFSYQKAGSDRILFHVSAKTSGWVGIGFGAKYAMRDARIVMGYVDAKGKAHISQEYGSGTFSHSQVKNPDVKLVSGTFKDGWTTLVFTLPIHSKIKEGFSFKKGKSLSVILAYGKNNAKNRTSHHGFATHINIDPFMLPV